MPINGALNFAPKFCQESFSYVAGHHLAVLFVRITSLVLRLFILESGIRENFCVWKSLSCGHDYVHMIKIILNLSNMSCHVLILAMAVFLL